MVILAWIRAEHSWQGELLAAISLPAASVPVATGSGLAWQDAALIAFGWSIGYACSVVAVHRVIARHRRAATWRDRCVAIALAAIAAAAGAFALPLVVAAVPLAALAAILAIRPPSAAHLRAIGVALVIASLVAGALTVAAAA